MIINASLMSLSTSLCSFLVCLFTIPCYALDRDNDGLDDAWQWHYAGAGLVSTDDTDGDGQTNLEESLAGTDPRDGADFLKATMFQATEVELALDWATQPGVAYQILHATAVDATFSPVGGAVAVGDGSVFSLLLNADGTGSIVSGRGTGSEQTLASGVDLGELVYDEDKRFFKIEASEVDTDGDGLTDWAEQTVGQPWGLDPTLVETRPGINDADFLIAWADGGQISSPVVTVVSSDRCAFENNAPLVGDDHGEVLITRTGVVPFSLSLVDMGIGYTGSTSVVCNGQCCMVVGVAGDEAAEVADYQLYDENDQLITGPIEFAYQQTERRITIKAVDDGIYEYPETLNLAAAAPGDGSYSLGATNGASIQILDRPDDPQNDIIFVGAFSRDGRAVEATDGTGYVSAKINGSRRSLTITSSFSNLTTPQQDAHVHKSNAGPSPGDIVYAITEIPYDEVSDPLNGPLDDYPWDLTLSAGAVPSGGGSASRQVIIDSLFAQNSETPLYLNIHTILNPAGEIWAFLTPTDGSPNPPGEPTPAATPGSADFPLLTGVELEREVRRFLDQSTFGGTEGDVAALLSSIETQRLSDPSYHRITAFEAWIDAQVALDQTYMVDYHLADNWQLLVNGGHFDPSRNPGATIGNVAVSTPTLPTTWPSVDRSDPDSEKWVMNQPFPMDGYQQQLSSMNRLDTPNRGERRTASWMPMLNAHDQLRQKLGYSLQQILVVSAVTGEVESQRLAFLNYTDQLNAKAFSHYRDLLGYVNNSPIMGNWLSSLMNQREADLNGDGEPDVFADENLARENMQLFSVGLFEQWEDGSLKLGADGSPLPTYDNDDIKELAKILTGQSYSKNSSFGVPTDWGGPSATYDSLPDNTNFDTNLNQSDFGDVAYYYPMKMFPEYHDTSAIKTIVGGKQITNYTGVDVENTPDATLEQLAQQDLEDAIDWLAGAPGDGSPDYDGINSHGSTPAFICRRLIQRFTTSNPSKDYLHRVSRAFKDSEGNMLTAVKAILLDPEARVFDINNTTFGLKKNPLEAYIQIHRNLEAITRVPMTEADTSAYPYDYAVGDYSLSSNPNLYLETFDYPASQIDNHQRNFRFQQAAPTGSGSSGLQIDIHYQPTVFNWYQPDFSPGGEIAAAGLVAPEMQLINDTDVVRNINYLQTLARNYAVRESASLGGHRGTRLSGDSANQQIAFGTSNSADVDRNDSTQLPVDLLTDALYPSTPPTATSDRTSESLADEALVDALDMRLTFGLLKEKYPYDASDNDDPHTPGVDTGLRNPRESIIDALGAWGDPYGSSGETSRRQKAADAIYMITFTPEFMIRK